MNTTITYTERVQLIPPYSSWLPAAFFFFFFFITFVFYGFCWFRQEVEEVGVLVSRVRRQG
jgi:hypothetical protein